MRKSKAFNFIPELIGDVNRVRELSNNPIQFYIETGLTTIRSASDLYELFSTKKTNKSIEQEITSLEEKKQKAEQLKSDNQIKEILFD